MKKRRITVCLIALVLLFTAGCGSKNVGSGNSSKLPSKVDEVGNTVENIDDMSDWTGKNMNLIYWFCQGGQAPTIGKKAKKDVVRSELKRVTGIDWDADQSFDNNGDNGDSKISKIIATNSWPDVAYNLDKNMVEKLIKNDKIWDLTEMIPKYMPNYMKIVNADEKTKRAYEELKVNGQMRYFTQVSSGAAPYLNDEYDEQQYMALITPEETRAWIWVRDDILKKLYPNAKTQDEIKKQYVETGKFSSEDMTDVVINSNDALEELLVKINNLRITESGRKVWPFYTHSGTDNWDILTVFNFMAGAGCQSSVNYFAYYDNTKKQMVRTADQEWFKKQMRFYNSLINKGLSSQESLIDNKASFEQKKNNGEYAVIYGNTPPPTDEVLKAAGKNYSYRKVLVDIPMDYSKFIKFNTSSKIFDGATWTFFKTTNIKTETDLEQVLRYFDFFYSEAGQKASYWGPKKGGLYTEDSNGNLKFTDQKLEEDYISNGTNDMQIEYGFSSFPAISDFRVYPSKYSPKIIYSRYSQRKGSEYTNSWRYSIVESASNYPNLKINFSLWNWTPHNKNLKKYWDARQSSEDAFKLIFTAKNGEDFEKYYSDMLAVLDRNGLTQETMNEWNGKFKEENKDYIDALENWKPNK